MPDERSVEQTDRDDHEPHIDDATRRWAWILGVAGLIPFVGLSVAAWMIAPPLHQIAASAQIVYATVILTFVGALHWGIALARSSGKQTRSAIPAMVWSVVPSLYAFAVAQLVYRNALSLLALGLVLALIVDIAKYRNDDAVRWFLPLRLLLTSVAVISLMSTFVALGT